MNEERCLILFARYPEKGKVKSRLARSLDEGVVVHLYRAFIEDLLANMSKGDYQLRIACHPGERIDEFRKEFGSTFSYMPQEGANLGERMINAFVQCFSDSFHSVILIGSDIPDLPQRIIQESFEALKNSDVVIGPSCDGGYYLIGFSGESFTPALFKGIAWGTDNVYRMTIDILQKSGICFHVLPFWRDIDRLEDIEALINDSGKKGFDRSRTMACIRKYDLKGG